MKKKRIAITGYSFRLPGTNAACFWSDLLQGKNLVSQVAPDRWSQEAYWHPSRSHPGTSYTFAAGSIGDIAAFDADFFGISPREAAQIDPQQRLLLELSWEALENAGTRPSSVRGSACGVYIGVSTIDYSFRLADDLAAIDSSTATGTSSSIVANRISYAFDLRGPSLAVDTACSSSLVAFHLACRSIATGETTQALAGGVSLHMHPYGFVTFSKASMLSRRGRCSVFDAAGDGYVRSEGAGIFVLKDYDRALEDGDRILAMVAGSTVNSDGRKSGLTVPSVGAQAALLTQSYATAGIEPAEIDYVEAHGTGTAVGDPVETHALGEALGQRRPDGSPLLIGSVKSNLGHLEAAAGVAGLVKALHCIEHRAVPATIHLEEPNPSIRFAEWNLKVPTAPTPLKSVGRIVIGINSFGFGGANAHVILESPEPRAKEKRRHASGARLPVLLSARSAAALREAAREHAAFLRNRGDAAALYDIAWSTIFHRDWHEHRAFVAADSTSALTDALQALAEGSPAVIPMETGVALPVSKSVAFIYSGNGSQWEGMGQQLLQEEPAFRDAVRAVDAIYKPLAGSSIEDELAGRNGTGRYAFTEVAQPALFALQVGITCVLRQRGLAPAAVAGHSVGEVAAAWASGALSLAQAVHVIHHRSRLQGTTRGMGRMTAVALGEQDALRVLEELGLTHSVTVAGVNSSQSVTVAGAVSALAALEAHLARREVSCRRLDLDYAFHSPVMDAIGPDLARSLANLAPEEARVAFHSSVTGGHLDGPALGADYWWRNIREPVRFEHAVKSMQAQGAGIFVEVGPHALLRGYVLRCLLDEEIQGRVIATGLRNDGSASRLWSAVFQAAIAGAGVDWKAHFPGRGRFAALPNYPWQREHYWHSAAPDRAGALARRKDHPLLGYRVRDCDWAWENCIDTQLQPALADHVIGEATVMPGTGYAEMALAAALLWLGEDAVEIEHLEMHSPLILGEAQSKCVRFDLDPADGRFTIRSRDYLRGEAWTLHAGGRILRDPQGLNLHRPAFAPPARPADSSGAGHVNLTRTVGLDYGPAFQAIDEIWIEGGSAYATFRVPDSIEPELPQFHIHPALLDCTFQLIIQLLRDEYVSHAGIVYVPARIDSLQIRGGRFRLSSARATLKHCSPHSITASFTLYDSEGRPVVWIPQARFNSVRLRKVAADRLHYLGYQFVPMPHPLSPTSAPRRLFDDMQKTLSELTKTSAGRASFRRYATEIEPLLESLCARFAVRALRSLAANGHLLTATDIQACLDANPAAAPFLARLIGFAEEDRAVERAGDAWHFLPDEDLPAPEDIWNSLIADYPDYLPVFHSVGRVGMHLAHLLRGRRTLDQILPRECTAAALAYPMLVDSGLQDMQDVLRDLVCDTLSRLPAGRRFRIVEIAADGPVFAPQICRSIDFNRCDYTFVAVGSALPDECSRLQEQHPNAALRLLNPDAGIETGVVAAGDQFQLVVMSGDFRTEHDCLFAMAHARRVLSARGVLLILKQHASRWMDFVFGGRPSWWTGAADGSWVSRHRPSRYWRRQMLHLGFQNEIALEFAPDSATGPYLLLAQQSGTVSALPPPPEPGPRNWILLADKEGYSAGFAAQLTRRLEAQGDHAVLVTPASRFAAVAAGHYQLNPADASHFETLLSLLTAAAGRIDGILHLHGLNGQPDDSAPLLLMEKQVDRCAAAAAIQQACESAQLRTACWLVTTRAAIGWSRGDGTRAGSASQGEGMDATLWGFGRSLMNEASLLTLRLVDIDEPAALDAVTYSLAREIAHPDAEQEIVLTASGDRYVPRLRLESQASRRPDADGMSRSSTVRLGFQFPGQLRGLRWETHPRTAPGQNEIEVDVRATGLNFRDVMYTLGLLSEDAIEGGFAGPTLGLEFAGVVSRVGPAVRGYAPGDRVAGFGPMSFSNRVVTRAGSLCPIPGNLSFEAAATIPGVFFTVHYALNYLARLQEGERILIHGAAGGVGIAAVQMAKWCGAEIFATAGSDEKRDFLRLLGVEHVFDSRSLAFADEILAATNGEGVDVVLNSLAGEAINRNLKTLRPCGRFLELGKRDFQENTRIGLRPFRNNISYFGIDADQIMKERPQLTEKLFREVMDLFGKGVLHPLPYRCYEADDVVDAFRCMQQSRHIGKIVVTYRNGVRLPRAPQQPARRLELPADATYLVTGGLNGFGLKTAEWLLSKGARNLVLISRSGAADAETSAAVAALREGGNRVHAAACDVTDRAALSALLSEVTATLPPLRGIVHAAAVIEDGLIRNMSREQIRRVFAPKILGCQYLHELTLDRKLDFFILYSSATTLFGNPGQGNYVAANAYLEAFTAARRAAGLPALCVSWGAIDDAGFLARNRQVKEALEGRMGGAALASAVALDALEELLLDNRSGLAVLEFDWRALNRFLSTAGSPKFSELALAGEDAGESEGGGEDVRTLLAKLTPADLHTTFVEMLKKEVGDILRIPPDRIDEERVLYDMGLDSLMGVELATAVEARFSVRLPVLALSENPTIAKLTARIISELTGQTDTGRATPAEDMAAQARQIAIRHADDAHADAIVRTAEALQAGEHEQAGRLIN